MNELVHTSVTTDRRHERRATIRVLADIGLAGPVLFAVGVIVAGAVTPGYSHLSEPISQLAEPARPYWLIQVAGFVVFGISMIAVAFALWHSPSTGLRAKLGIALVGFAGFNMVLTGLFRTDPMGQELPSVSGQIHETTAGVDVSITDSRIPRPRTSHEKKSKLAWPCFLLDHCWSGRTDFPRWLWALLRDTAPIRRRVATHARNNNRRLVCSRRGESEKVGACTRGRLSH